MLLSTLKLELERVPDPARRPRPEEKLVVNKPNTRNNPGLNLSQACELYKRVDSARDNGVSNKVKLEEIEELVKLEPTCLTTRCKPEFEVNYPERLDTQKLELIPPLFKTSKKHNSRNIPF